jgi:hypothetical protein
VKTVLQPYPEQGASRGTLFEVVEGLFGCIEAFWINKIIYNYKFSYFLIIGKYYLICFLIDNPIVDPYIDQHENRKNYTWPN